LHGTMLTSNQASQIEYGVNVNVIMVPTNESLTQNNENKNQKKTHLQNTKNTELCIYINMNKITPNFEVEGELLSEIHVRCPLLVLIELCLLCLNHFSSCRKEKSKDYNSAPTHGIKRDYFLPRYFPSITMSITPPYDQIFTTSFPTKTPTTKQHARVNETCEGL